MKMALTGLDIEKWLNSFNFQRDEEHAWGYQLRCLNSSLYAAKFLIFTNSHPGSLHTHKDKKDETFICLCGRFFITGDIACILNPGDVLHIPFNTRHRARALEYPAIILEVSTEDSDEFTYRVE